MSPEHLELITELARGAQRFAMYPPGHPSRAETARTLAERLDALLPERGELEITVRKDQLTLLSGETDPTNPLYAGLAQRLYQNQLRTIALRKGLREEELEAFLTAVARPLGKSGEPLTTGGPAALEQWSHIGLTAIAYDGLTIAREGEEGSGQAVGAGPGGSGEEPGSVPEGDEPAAGADMEDGGASGPEGGAAPQIALSEMPQLARVLKGQPVEDPEAFRHEMARLILNMPPKSLGRLIKAVPGLKGAAEAGADSLSGAVAEMIEGASGDREGPGASLLRILTKLGMQAAGGSGDETEEGEEEGGDLGELVRQLGSEWEIDDPTPEDYGRALKDFSRQTPILAAEPFWLEEPEPARVVQMSLELEEVGRITHDAVREMMAESTGLIELVGLLERSGEDSPAAGEIWPEVAVPKNIRRILTTDSPDLKLLDRMLPHLDPEGVETLLDILDESEATTLRQALVERLVGMGSVVGPPVVARLEAAGTTLRRELMSILAVLPALPEDFVLEPWIIDPDAVVRREAIRMALTHMEDREIPIAAALSDNEPRIIALGLDAAESFCPPTLAPLVIGIVGSVSSTAPLRLAAIRALSTAGTPEALQTLLKIIWVRRFLFGRRLAEKSAEMLEALAAIQRGWPQDPESRPVLEAAGKSKDAQVRAVVRPRGKGAS